MCIRDRVRNDPTNTLTGDIAIQSIGEAPSVYVYLNNLPINSYHGHNVNSIQRLIAVVPRFNTDDTSNIKGLLYYEANQPIYVSLNNTNEMVLNEIQVHLKYYNGNQCVDLITPCELVLHLKQAWMKEIF